MSGNATNQELNTDSRLLSSLAREIAVAPRTPCRGRRARGSSQCFLGSTDPNHAYGHVPERAFRHPLRFSDAVGPCRKFLLESRLLPQCDQGRAEPIPADSTRNNECLCPP